MSRRKKLTEGPRKRQQADGWRDGGVPTALVYDDAAGPITVSSSTGTTVLTYNTNGIDIR
jgi:hypothetical protein